MKKRAAVAWIVISILAAGAVGVGAWLVTHDRASLVGLGDKLRSSKSSGADAEGDASAIVASGFVEAHLVEVSAEQGARVLSIRVGEGDTVAQGDVLAQLDDSILSAQIEVARTDLAMAEAVLAQVRSGAAPESLRRAEAEVSQAKAAEAAAQVALEDALAILEKPQELDLSLTELREELTALEYKEQQAEAWANASQAGLSLADETLRLLEGTQPHDEWVLVGEYSLGELPPGIPLPPDPADGVYYFGSYRIEIHSGVVTVYVRVPIEVPADWLDEARDKQATATYEAWTAWAGVDQAHAAWKGAEDLLAELERQRAHPLSLEAQVHTAEANRALAAAAVKLAESSLQGLEMGATPEEIDVAEAQVDTAAAALKALEVQRDQYVVRAPIAGIVLQKAVGAGDVVVTGTALLTLADTGRLRVTAYVPESSLGSVLLDQRAAVSVDAFPGRTFAGRVSRIASQAEFSPKSVQTREERVTMVFAVQIAIENPSGALKPGMPADVVFSSQLQDGPETFPNAGQTPGRAGALGTGDAGTTALPLAASGSIEGLETAIVSELGGRIDQVLVKEGDAVETGQVVIKLEARSIAARLEEATAAQAQASAGLAQVKAGAHPAALLAAQAALDQAQAECLAAEGALHDAERMLDEPQELNLRILEERAQLAVAEAQVEQAKSRLTAAGAEQERYRSQGSLEEKGMYQVWSYQVDAAQAAVESAQATVRAAQEKLGSLEAIRDSPLVLLSQVHGAQGRTEVACAGAAVAQAGLDELKAGARDEEIRIAEARLAQTGAAVRLVETQIRMLSLRSPIAGEVTECPVDVGQVAVAGATLLRVTNLDEVSLVAYVTVEQLGSVTIGQRVEILVDAYPGEAFPGSVSRIAEQAEFAPSNMQTEEDRAAMAVAVTIRLPNPAHKLRPGMLAEVTFLQE